MVFFSKKHFIADLLEGLVDFHNHLLPNIDDGSDSLDTTKSMIDTYRELGFEGVYTTPHTMEDYYGNDVQSINECFENTKSLLVDESADFLLGTASEYMMDGAFPNIIQNKDYLTLPNNHLLFEFSYFQKPFNAEELIFEMKNQDIKPVLAHPERYRYLSVEEMEEFKDRGCLLQLNILSLSGHYGNDAKQKALNLLANDSYSILATDAHKVKHLTKIKEMKISKKLISKIKSLLEEQKLNFMIN